jgi:periplasmic divalent cation tolerance protein
MSNAQLILSTAGSADEARGIARELVERGLAACVNLVPQIESVYRWSGKVENAQEWLLIIKTQAEYFQQVHKTIQELHSYDLPECIALDIASGSEAYLSWIAENTGRI